MNIKELFNKLNMDDIEYCVYAIVEKEFEIYEALEDQKENRLGFVYYKSWICTDARVGLRVWLFDKAPVCISYQPGRKCDEIFYWVSFSCKEKVKKYVDSLCEHEDYNSYLEDDTIDIILNDIT